jgi:hypothetical protein
MFLKQPRVFYASQPQNGIDAHVELALMVDSRRLGNASTASVPINATPLRTRQMRISPPAESWMRLSNQGDTASATPTRSYDDSHESAEDSDAENFRSHQRNNHVIATQGNAEDSGKRQNNNLSLSQEKSRGGKGDEQIN